LQVGDRESSRWNAGPASQELAAAAGDLVGPLCVEVKDQAGLVLCRGSVEILAGLTLDVPRSLPVATADGSMAAEFVWLGMKDSDRDRLASAFAELGFDVTWRNNILLVTGNLATLGRRIVPLPGPDPVAHVWTLPSLDIRVSPPGLVQVGQCVAATVGGVPLD